VTGGRDDVPARLSSAQNTARVLKEFSSGRPGARGVTELSRRLGLGKSTVHRLLSALVAEGLLEHDPETSSYRLALTAIELGAAVTERLHLHEAAIPSLVRLQERTHQTVSLGVLDGSDVIYVERLFHRDDQTPATAHEARVPAHCCSSGKVIMAYLPDGALNTLLMAHPLSARTRFTITDPIQLRRELRMVRARGWSRTAHEYAIGQASIAVAVRDPGRGQVVAAVSVARKMQHCRDDDMRPYLNATVLTAAAIARNLSDQAQHAKDRKVAHTAHTELGQIADRRWLAKSRTTVASCD